MNKFKCVSDKEDVGIFSKDMQKQEGLTLGKIYKGSLVTVGQSGSLCIAVFNDDQEWEVYSTELFVPGEE